MRERFDFWSVVTSRIFLSIAGVAVIALVVGIAKSAIRRHQVNQEIVALTQELNSLETRQDSLQRLLKYISTPEFKEREARLRFGLKRPGEQVVVLPGEAPTLALSHAVAVPSSAPPNWRLWYNYFFVE